MRGVVSGSLWALIISGVGLGIASQVGNPPRAADVTQTEMPEVTPPQTVETPEPVETPEVIAETDTAIAPDVAEEPTVTSEPEVTVAEPEVPTVPETVAPLVEPTEEVVAVAPPLETETAPEDDVIAPQRPVLSGATEAPDPVLTIDNQPPQIEAVDGSGTEASDEGPVATADVVAPIAPVTAPEEGEAVTVEGTVPDVQQTPVPDEPVETAEIVAPTPGISEPEAQPEPDAPVEQPAIDDLLAGIQNPDSLVTPPDTAEAPSSDEQFEGIARDEDVPATAERPSPVIVVPEQPSANLADLLGVTESAVPTPSEEPIILDDEDAPAGVDVVTDPLQDDIVISEDASDVPVNRPEPATPLAPETAATEEADVTQPADNVDPDAPAIVRFAADFEHPGDLPLVNILLLDDGRVPSGSVIDIALPITVVLDPLAPDAGIRMEAYRKAGVEIGLRAGLPTGATPSDVEVTMEAALAALPQSVVLFSDGQDGVQGSRSVSEQVVQILAAEGRGLVAVSRGFGNALRFAEQADVPAIGVTRSLDELGENEAAIGRALDQTAFRARQSGNAVVVAETSTYMLSALRSWAQRNDGDQLRLAPITAVLGVTPIEEPATTDDSEESEATQ